MVAYGIAETEIIDRALGERYRIAQESIACRRYITWRRRRSR